MVLALPHVQPPGAGQAAAERIGIRFGLGDHSDAGQMLPPFHLLKHARRDVAHSFHEGRVPMAQHGFDARGYGRWAILPHAPRQQNDLHRTAVAGNQFAQVVWPVQHGRERIPRRQAARRIHALHHIAHNGKRRAWVHAAQHQKFRLAHVLRLVHHDVAEFLAFQFADPLRDQRDERRVFRGNGAPLAREGFLRGGAQLGVFPRPHVLPKLAIELGRGKIPKRAHRLFYVFLALVLGRLHALIQLGKQPLPPLRVVLHAHGPALRLLFIPLLNLRNRVLHAAGKLLFQFLKAALERKGLFIHQNKLAQCLAAKQRHRAKAQSFLRQNALLVSVQPGFQPLGGG